MLTNIDYQKEYQKLKSKYLDIKQNDKIEIYLIRHGQTDWNVLRKHQGQEADNELNDVGRSEARKTGLYLKEYRMNDKHFDCIYSSPLKRAKETAAIIKDVICFNSDILYDDRLKERKQGKMVGLTKDDNLIGLRREIINKLMPVDPIEKYVKYDDIMEFSSRELDLGFESDRELKIRASEFIEMVVSGKYRKIIVISHGGLLFNMIQKMFNINACPHGNFNCGDNCYIIYIVYLNGVFNLVSPPNTDHLCLYK